MSTSNPSALPLAGTSGDIDATSALSPAFSQFARPAASQADAKAGEGFSSSKLSPAPYSYFRAHKRDPWRAV